MNPRPLGRSGPISATSECLWSAAVDSIYTEIGWLPTPPLYRLSPVISVSIVLSVMGFRWAPPPGRSHGETRPAESSALVVTGCLPLSRTVFDHFGVADAEQESAVDISSDHAHRRVHDLPAADGSAPAEARGAAAAAAPGARSRRVARPASASVSERLNVWTARRCRFGTTVRKPAGHTVPDRSRDRDRVRREVLAGAPVPVTHRHRTGCGTVARNLQVTRCRRIRGTVPGAGP